MATPSSYRKLSTGSASATMPSNNINMGLGAVENAFSNSMQYLTPHQQNYTLAWMKSHPHELAQ